MKNQPINWLSHDGAREQYDIIFPFDGTKTKKWIFFFIKISWRNSLWNPVSPTVDYWPIIVGWRYKACHNLAFWRHKTSKWILFYKNFRNENFKWSVYEVSTFWKKNVGQIRKCHVETINEKLINWNNVLNRRNMDVF